VGGAEEYDANLERMKQQDPEKHGNKTWKDDRIEATEWWRCYCLLLSSSSSCCAHPNHKRIGRESLQPSQVYQTKTIGESGLQETLELRLIERVNKYD